MSQGLVTINAGGTRFQTRQETLTRGSPYFYALFKGPFAEGRGLDEESEQKSRETEIFLDMNPALFGLCLDRMRYPDYELPKKMPGLATALGFLGMDMESPEEMAKKKEKAAKPELDMSPPVVDDPISILLAQKIQLEDEVRIWSCPRKEWFKSTVKQLGPDFRFEYAVEDEIRTVTDSNPGSQGRLRSVSEEATKKIFDR